jgi:hypothetical protein
VAWSRRGEKFGPLLTSLWWGSECFGWDGNAVAGVAQRCRREGERVNQSAMPCALRFHSLRPSRGRQADAACTLFQSASPRLLPVSSSLWQFPTRASDRVPVRLCCLLRRRSFGVCAARLNAPSSSTAINSMLSARPTPREQVEDFCYGRASNAV